MQMSCAVLLHGTFSRYDMAYKIALYSLAQCVIPNYAFNQMVLFDCRVKLGMYPSTALMIMHYAMIRSLYRVGVNIYLW